MINYHCHSQYSNIATPDVVITNEQRIKRAVELGHTVVSGIEHGSMGNFFEFVKLAKKYNVKPILGSEVYFVKDRLREYPTAKNDETNDTIVLLGDEPDEDKILPLGYNLTGNFRKDATNSHLILLAKDEIGRKGINKAISEANRSGFYRKPRLDLDILSEIPRGHVWVTTACLGGIWKYQDVEDILSQLHEMFGDDLFLEVQYHDQLKQTVVNAQILELSESMGIKIIAGMDTHMITPQGSKIRDAFIASRGIVYPDEQGWFLDFPDEKTVVERFKKQNILSEKQIYDAIENTNIFESVEPYTSHIFDTDSIKLPTIYPELSQEERDVKFTNLILDKWKEERNNIEFSKWTLYEKEIQKELEIVCATKMADYFLLNYEIIVEAVKMGGMLTLTGRGSAAGFYLAKLLGFTTIDRIAFPVKLYPERFMSTERMLETKSVPDVDFNVGNPEVFAEAQDKVLGVGKAYRMLTYTTVKIAGAWKMYARYKGVSFDDANMVSDQLKELEKAQKYADDGEEIRVEDFVDERFLEDLKKSTQFLGLVQTTSSHPCAFLLLDEGTIDEEIGLIRMNSGGKPVLCAMMDGKSSEELRFLKNDWLKVTVVKLIHTVYQKIGIEPHTVAELMDMCDGDQEVWDVYEKGRVMGINQVEVEKTAQKVMRYKPKNLSELSAFVAAIRPAFQKDFEHFVMREEFDYGVPSLDEILQTEEFPYSYLLYQELLMAVLAYAGIPIFRTHEAVKAISKKRVQDVLKYKDTFIIGLTKRLVENREADREGAGDIAHRIWAIIEDAASYSFNASHSGCVGADSLYGAWQKAHHTLTSYETLLQEYELSSDKDRIVKAKVEAERHYNIKFPSFKWGQDNRSIVANYETNSITMSLSIIKGFGSKIAEQLLELHGDFEGGTFLDLLIFASETERFSKAKWLKLIRIDYFSEFGSGKMLENFYQEFIGGKSRYGIKLKSKLDRAEQLMIILSEMEEESYTILELIENELEILGEIRTKWSGLTPAYRRVMSLDTTYSPKIVVHCLRTGTEKLAKVPKKVFRQRKFSVGDMIFCDMFEKRNKWKKVGEDFEQIPDTFEDWLIAYEKIDSPLEYYLNSEDSEMKKELKIGVREWK